jgi:hypothetical protein
VIVGLSVRAFWAFSEKLLNLKLSSSNPLAQILHKKLFIQHFLQKLHKRVSNVQNCNIFQHILSTIPHNYVVSLPFFSNILLFLRGTKLFPTHSFSANFFFLNWHKLVREKFKSLNVIRDVSLFEVFFFSHILHNLFISKACWTSDG